MRYFKDKKGELTSIDDRIWPIVLRNEPWIKETDKNGHELGTKVTVLKDKTPVEDKVIPVTPASQLKGEITDQDIKKVTEPVKPVKVDPVTKLKEEKLTPKRNAKGTRTKRKAKATKA